MRCIGLLRGCREEGIRTLDTLLAYTHFPGVLLQPLGHLSVRGANLGDWIENLRLSFEEFCDVELAHLHKRIHGFWGCFRVAHQLTQNSGYHLPGNAEFVF